MTERPVTLMKLHKTLRIVILCAVCAALAAAALYFLPFVRDVNLKFAGAVVTAEGDILENTNITLSGQKLNYLFQEDKVQLWVKTESSDWIFATQASPAKFRDPYIDVPYMSMYTAIASGTDSSLGYYAVSLEDGYFIAGYWNDPSKFLVGSKNENIEPETILEYFSQWIDFYFPEQ